MHIVPAELITFELDEDVLEVAREQADETREQLGRVIFRKVHHGFFAREGPVVYPDGFKSLRTGPLERIKTT